MNRIIGIFIVLFCTIVAKAQISVVPHVDERTELLSIVFRLAEAKEYVTNDLKGYVGEIDDYFAAYKNHDVVKFAQDVRSEHGVGYDAVMSMATHIEIVNQEIKIKENIRQGSIDKRWTEENITKFVQLLNLFYKESKFYLFFEQHQDFYQKAESNFKKILEDVDFGWFEKFYGEENKSNFLLIISLVNGPSNYGTSVFYTDRAEDIYAIVGTWRMNDLGEPTYSNQVIETVIHEFNHSFCNACIEAFYPQLEEQGMAFFAFVKEKMARQAYGSAKTMLYEILVRACVIKYYESIDSNSSSEKRRVSRELSNGFLWMEELVHSLSVYEKNRDKYPTLKSYMPEIVRLQGGLSPEKLYEKIEEKKPVFLGTNIENGDQDVDPQIEKITLKFSVPMSIRNNGTSHGKFPEFFPEFQDRKAQWNEETKMEWSIYVKLKPNTQYSISFPSAFFLSNEDYLNPKETYYLDFKTGDIEK